MADAFDDIAAEERCHARRLWFAFGAIALAAALFAACVLTDKDDFAEWLLALYAGLFGGFGLGRLTR